MIYGQEREIKSIDQFANGRFVRIVDLDAGKSALSRFCALGLIPGTMVQVLTKGNGPVRLKFRDTEVVIGRKSAEKIKVQPVEDNV